MTDAGDDVIDRVGNRSLVLFDRGDEVTIQAGNDGVRFLLVSGKPLEEPVAWRGPIVMNTREELQQAYAELTELVVRDGHISTRNAARAFRYKARISLRPCCRRIVSHTGSAILGGIWPTMRSARIPIATGRRGTSLRGYAPFVSACPARVCLRTNL